MVRERCAKPTATECGFPVATWPATTIRARRHGTAATSAGPFHDPQRRRVRTDTVIGAIRSRKMLVPSHDSIRLPHVEPRDDAGASLPPLTRA